MEGNGFKRRRWAIFATLTLLMVVLMSGCNQNDTSVGEFDSFIKTAQEGDSFYLGTYEQDNNLDNGVEPIEWVVLEKENGYFTAITKYAIECMVFNEVDESGEWGPVDWASSTIRQWLNNDFYNMAFTQEEKGYLRLTKLENPDNKYFEISGGPETEDYVFLLDRATIEYLYTDLVIGVAIVDNPAYDFHFERTMSSPTEYEPLVARLTDYAKEKFIASLPTWMDYSEVYEADYGKNSCYWWTCSRGDDENQTLIISPRGGVSSSPSVAAEGIRPMISIETKRK